MSVPRGVVVSARDSLRLRKPVPACLTASNTFSRSLLDLTSRSKARHREHIRRLGPREA
jgi:hypothetical protein